MLKLLTNGGKHDSEGFAKIVVQKEKKEDAEEKISLRNLLSFYSTRI